jgi:hypothetical protein
MNKNLLSIPPQVIRDSVVSVLSSFNTPLSIDELQAYVSEDISLSHSMHTSEELKYFSKVISDMEQGGKLEINEKIVNLSTQESVIISDYSPYKLYSEASNVIEVSGDKMVYTVGSQYYQDVWNQLKKEDIIQVELIPEQGNPYDKNAIAVVFKDNIIGHLTRSDAQEYREYLDTLTKNEIAIIVNGLVEVPEGNLSYKYLKLFMPSGEQLLKLL